MPKSDIELRAALVGLGVAFAAFAVAVGITLGLGPAADATLLAGVGLVLVFAGRFAVRGTSSGPRRRWMRPLEDPEHPVLVTVSDPSRVPDRRQVLTGLGVSGFGVGLFAAQSLPVAMLLMAGAAAFAVADPFRRR